MREENAELSVIQKGIINSLYNVRTQKEVSGRNYSLKGRWFRADTETSQSHVWWELCILIIPFPLGRGWKYLSEKNDALKEKGPNKRLKSNQAVIFGITKFFTLLFKKWDEIEVIKATHIITIEGARNV